jgi:CPA2 family monovalent cation:H+ antiporter-2
VIGKFLLTLPAVRLSGHHLRTAILSAGGMGQIGEFSFVIASLAVAARLVPQEFYSLVLGAAVVSILLTPAMFQLSLPLYHLVSGLPPEEEAAERELEEVPLRGHAIICGYGRVGRNVAASLEEFGIPLMVIDYDQDVVYELRERDVPVLYGDAGSANLLRQAGARHAALAVVAVPDAITTHLAIRHLKRLNPKVKIVARAHVDEEIERAYADGAEEVVQAEFEASLELIHHSLVALGISERAAHGHVDRIRAERYHRFCRLDLQPPPEEPPTSLQ